MSYKRKKNVKKLKTNLKDAFANLVEEKCEECPDGHSNLQTEFATTTEGFRSVPLNTDV